MLEIGWLLQDRCEDFRKLRISHLPDTGRGIAV
jgi:hypothetical protein